MSKLERIELFDRKSGALFFSFSPHYSISFPLV